MGSGNNGFEHVVKFGNYYLIRVKDITSHACITQTLGFYLDNEFDIDVFRTLALKQTKMTKVCSCLYRFLSSGSRFDFMFRDNSWYEFNCRIVRLKMTDDSHECIITNLDRNEFSMDDVKDLYNKRWSIETLFREVKYVLGLNALHSKKREKKKNIYIKLTLQDRFI